MAAADSGPSKGEIYYSDEEDEDEESREKARRAQDESGMTRRQRRQAAVRSDRFTCRILAYVLSRNLQ